MRRLLVCLVVSVWATAIAQQSYIPGVYTNPVFRNIYDRQFMTNIAVNGAMRSQMLRDATSGKGKAVRPANDPLVFKATGVPVISDQELATLGTKEEVEAFERMANGLLSAYIQESRANSLIPNDVGVAFTYFAVKNYMVYKNALVDYKGYQNRGILITNQIPNYVDSTQEQKVYQQFRTVLLADPSLVKQSDADKERLTGVLALMGGLTWKLYDEAITTGDEAGIERARAMARQNLENFFKTPADQVSIGSRGLAVGPAGR
ncbi:MAG: DUF6683 family protein [Vulcanimicrobiota bacterium]